MNDVQIAVLVSQPIDGLLYDLDLLPEQVKPGSREDLLRRVIEQLHKEVHK